MRVIILDDYDKCCAWTANYLAAHIKVAADAARPIVLGLPTGSTPLGVYRNLIAKHKSGSLSFAQATTFNMDEYLGLSPEHPQSYHYFMWNNFLNYIDIQKQNVHILDGMTSDADKECQRYEQRIVEAGGIDVFFGGTGADGHIAFNEPASSLNSRTRLKTLTPDTRKANSRFFDGNIDAVPRQALTVGIATIMDAREVLILASGYNKSEAVHHAVEGSVSHIWPLSILQMHPRAIIVCDAEAASGLRTSTVKYFCGIEGL